MFGRSLFLFGRSTTSSHSFLWLGLFLPKFGQDFLGLCQGRPTGQPLPVISSSTATKAARVKYFRKSLLCYRGERMVVRNGRFANEGVARKIPPHSCERQSLSLSENARGGWRLAYLNEIILGYVHHESLPNKPSNLD